MTATAPLLSEQATVLRVRYRLAITGTIQGVGFRPFFYRRALTQGVTGYVMNSTDGVIAEIEGTTDQINALLHDLRTLLPANAKISEIEQACIPLRGQSGFSIRNSSTTGLMTVTVPADLASCDACIDELFTPDNRRYHYPFTNCAECGPRYSIIDATPWDRERTAMSGFSLCAVCASEYQDPGNRRFHAETICCPDCGPQVEFRDATGMILTRKDDALRVAVAAIRRGNIVAIKGPGGYQLLVDAGNTDAVNLLRERKHRRSKPFAVMFPSLSHIRLACEISELEQTLLTGRERPIVLLQRRDAATDIALSVAPDNPYLGVMLPATPLQSLLLAELDLPLVATSGNHSDEPIVIDNSDAIERLHGIADYYLDHDCPVRRPVDDSVVRVVCGRPQILRRARGYAPVPIATRPIEPGIVASGGHLKSTIAITQKNSIVLSQHIGDLDHPLSRERHDTSLRELIDLYRVTPEGLSCDLHPDYYSTLSFEKRADGNRLQLLRIQHHLSHVAAVMAEHALTPPVLGVAWDGSGYGPDNTLWGGEFILVTDQAWERKAHLRQFRLPGGSTAIREPRRAAFGLLYEIYGDRLMDMDHLFPIAAFSRTERQSLIAMLEKDINSPITTSAGRLFDAVSALLGLCQTGSYEGEAACRLEWICASADTGHGYKFDIVAANKCSEWVLDWGSVIRQILTDLADGIAIATIARAFHRGLASAIASMASRMGIQTVGLTGGCFQNRMLMELSVALLRRDGLQVYWNEQVPPGDGGLALGQAYWAAQMTVKGES